MWDAEGWWWRWALPAPVSRHAPCGQHERESEREREEDGAGVVVGKRERGFCLEKKKGRTPMILSLFSFFSPRRLPGRAHRPNPRNPRPQAARESGVGETGIESKFLGAPCHLAHPNKHARQPSLSFRPC